MLLHRLVVLSSQLGPLREIVLCADPGHLALELYDVAAQTDLIGEVGGGAGRDFVVEGPELCGRSVWIMAGHRGAWYQVIDCLCAEGVDEVDDDVDCEDDHEQRGHDGRL